MSVVGRGEEELYWGLCSKDFRGGTALGTKTGDGYGQVLSLISLSISWLDAKTAAHGSLNDKPGTYAALGVQNVRLPVLCLCPIISSKIGAK